MQATFDLGATHNFIDPSLLEEDEIQPTYQSSVDLAIIDSRTDVIGKAMVNLRINNKEFRFLALVALRLRHKLVLGIPFVEKEQVIMDFHRHVVHLGRDQRTTAAFISHPPSVLPDLPLPKHGFPPDYSRRVNELLQDFRHVLAPTGLGAGTTSTRHCIKLTDSRPFRLAPYHYSKKKRTEIERQVQQMLAEGVIEPSHSPYNSPIVMAKKKDGTLRFCVDYRRLNEVTMDETQQIPRISDALKDLGDAKVFTTLDLKSGYWQIPMDETAKPYTAFTTPIEEYVAAAKELRVHQQILLHLADRRLRSYLRTAPTPPPSPKRSAPASTSQLTTQPAETSGTPPPAWRLIRLDTPPPPRTPRLDPRFNGVDPRRFRAPLDGAQTPPLPQEIERELRRQATHVSWPCSWRSTHSQEAEGPISSE
ncbi:hypothetical protein TKK_0003005 [Trichogramma kaykai]